MTAATWDDATRAGYEVIADRLVHLGTTDSPAMVIDMWQDPGHDQHPYQASMVVTVRPGVSRDSAEPFLPMSGLGGIAWETEPAATPRERFLEAMRQGHLRARERLTGEQGLVPLPR